MRRARALAAASLLSFGLLPGVVVAADAAAPACVLDGPATVVEGLATAADEGTYLLVPIEVPTGTTRVEVGYTWAEVQPLEAPVSDLASVLDLGLWDADGVEEPEAFRGWGGSRQGVLHRDQAPVFVQADAADRGFRAGAPEAGTWHVELGFGNVTPSGVSWRIEVSCLAVSVGTAAAPRPVDPAHVADPEPGWFHGDFHMHAFHSNSSGPTPQEVVDHAREVGLDFLPITEYVVPWHHDEWGEVAQANPDLLVWPGREVITYQGHGIVLGETPNVVEYRHGFRDITFSDIQAASVADGALFGIAHPSSYPPPLGDLCRGCAFELDDQVDWSRVTMVEVLTGPVRYDNAYLGGPGGGPGIEFPFMTTAIDYWEDLLLEGHRITAVSGSDAKQAAGHGASLTAVHADELSRAALTRALRTQRAYIRTKGIDSPTLDFTASAGDETVMIGGTLVADQATLSVGVRGGIGHRLDVTRNGVLIASLLVTADDWTMDLPAFRGPDEGPLGTFYRVDTVDPEGIRSMVSNPIWLASTPPVPVPEAEPAPGPPPSPAPQPEPAPSPSSEPSPLPATGGGSPLALVLLLAVAVGPLGGIPQLLRAGPRR